MNPFDLLARAGEYIRRGDRAREELPMVDELLTASREAACREICALVKKPRANADVKLWVAACRLEAAIGLRDELTAGIRSADHAREQAQTVQASLTPQGG